MARQPGSANFSGTIEALAGGPLDARSIVKTKADLTAVGSFEYPYIGMETYVVSENKKYRLIGDNPLVLANWEEIGSVILDTEIDETSENGVQNKVIAEALDGKADLDEDGKVDASQLRERELHQAEYDVLTEEEKMNGTTYYIDDSIDEGGATAVCGFTPIGTIISVMGTVAPRNYIACNGQVVNIDTYPELANYFEQQFGSKNHFGGDGVTTFAVPDLRGEFLRGTGTNSHENQGSGAEVGVHQDGTSIPKNYYNPNNNTPYITSDTNYKNYDTQSADAVKLRIVNASATSESSSYGTLFIPRPTNTSVLYCIAVRNIYVDARYDYSTDEKVVGTWIDGKPIYQKTISLGTSAIPNAEVTTTAHNISNIAEIIDIKAIVHATSGLGTTILPRVQDNNAAQLIGLDVDGTSIYLKGRGANFKTTYGSAYVTIQYTKTTD